MTSLDHDNQRTLALVFAGLLPWTLLSTVLADASASVVEAPAIGGEPKPGPG